MITESKIIEDRVQPDGRRAVTESHMLDTGITYFVYYLAEADADAQSIMEQRVPELNTTLTAEQGE